MFECLTFIDASRTSNASWPSKVPSRVLHSPERRHGCSSNDVPERHERKCPSKIYETLPPSLDDTGSNAHVSLLRLKQHHRTQQQLQQTLSSLLPSPSSTHLPTPQQISQTLQTHQLLLQRLAAQIAFLDEEVGALKDEFRIIWREKGGGGGSVRDVFDREKEGKYEEELRVEELGRSMRL